MKVVLNKCFGGFGLSMAAERRYLELKGKKAFFYHQTAYKHNKGHDEYERVDDIAEKYSFTITTTKDFGEKTNEIYEKDHYFYYGDIPRNDTHLIQVIEEIGKEANGSHAELEIIEIPDDMEWHIDDYDGIETLHESHRSW